MLTSGESTDKAALCLIAPVQLVNRVGDQVAWLLRGQSAATGEQFTMTVETLKAGEREPTEQRQVDLPAADRKLRDILVREIGGYYETIEASREIVVKIEPHRFFGDEFSSAQHKQLGGKPADALARWLTDIFARLETY